MEVTIDLRILNKVLLICQKNSTKLDQISKRQDKMEAMMVEKNDKIDQILSKFEVQNNADNKVVKDKGKKTKNEFYQVNIYFIINFFFVYTIFILISINLIYITGDNSKIVISGIPRTQANYGRRAQNTSKGEIRR